MLRGGDVRHPPFGGGLVAPSRAPRWLANLTHRLNDLVVDAAFRPQLDAHRRRLGLPPAPRVYNRWFLCRRALALWPEWFGPRRARTGPRGFPSSGFRASHATETSVRDRFPSTSRRFSRARAAAGCSSRGRGTPGRVPFLRRRRRRRRGARPTAAPRRRDSSHPPPRAPPALAHLRIAAPPNRALRLRGSPRAPSEVRGRRP